MRLLGINVEASESRGEPVCSPRRATQAQGRGVRGGGIYDYLHLVAARKAKARRMYTLNLSNFRAWHRTGDPEIVHPGH